MKHLVFVIKECRIDPTSGKARIRVDTGTFASEFPTCEIFPVGAKVSMMVKLGCWDSGNKPASADWGIITEVFQINETPRPGVTPYSAEHQNIRIEKDIYKYDKDNRRLKTIESDKP